MTAAHFAYTGVIMPGVWAALLILGVLFAGETSWIASLQAICRQTEEESRKTSMIGVFRNACSATIDTRLPRATISHP